MSIDEAIELLEGRYVTVSMCATYEQAHNINESIKMAIKALREKQTAEVNEPLTLEEVKRWGDTSMRCPVWIKFLDDGFVTPGIMDVLEPDGEVMAAWTCDAGPYLLGKDYGKTWLAYRHEPV